MAFYIVKDYNLSAHNFNAATVDCSIYSCYTKAVHWQIIFFYYLF